NAIAFTREGGIITLSAKRRKDGIEIKVADTGIGIPKEDQARILRPFEKASAKKGRTERGGAGLGLSLVQSIVGLHGGEIGIESEPDKGTTVTLFLPFETEKQAAA